MSNQPRWVERLDDLHLLTPLRVVLIVVVAWVIARVLRVVVARVLRRTLAMPGLLSRADTSRVDARQRALAVALRSAIIGVVWAIATITVVSELGINIGAFVATATVVGGAVAFGAQQLMRDLIAGFFVLAEDQFGVGDEVDLGIASGVVERVTLRSVRVRDGLGTVWFVPHGGVSRVGNLSKESAVSLDLEVARASSHPTVHAECEALCTTLRLDPDVGGLLVGPPQVTGLIGVRDDRLVFRLVAGTQPGAQHVVLQRWRVLALESFEAGRLSRP